MSAAIKSLLSSEMRFFSNPRKIKSDFNFKFHESLFIENDYRMAEALSLTTFANPLNKVRALIARGKTIEAQKFIESYQSEEKCELQAIEKLLELSRIQGFEGDWSRSRESATNALGLKPCGITKLSLHMIRAVSNFELKLFAQSESDLQVVESLVRIYSYSEASFFVHMLRIRMSIENGNIDAARKNLDRHWKKVKESPSFSLKYLKSLVRTELYLKNHRSGDVSSLCRAKFILCHRIGDRLYEGLAFLNYYLSLESSFRTQEIIQRYESYQKEFPRIGRIMTEISRLKSNIDFASTSAKNLSKNLEKHSVLKNDFIDIDIFSSPEEISAIAFIEKTFVVELRKKRISPLHPQTQKALSVLSISPLSKKDFFERVWEQKYCQNLHDSPIYKLLSRLRKMGLRANIENGSVQLKEALVVL